MFGADQEARGLRVESFLSSEGRAWLKVMSWNTSISMGFCQTWVGKVQAYINRTTPRVFSVL